MNIALAVEVAVDRVDHFVGPERRNETGRNPVPPWRQAGSGAGRPVLWRQSQSFDRTVGKGD